MKLTEKKISSTLIYDGRILKLYRDGVELPDGKTSVREIVRHNGGAAVLFVRGEEVALVKQFRYAYGKTLYEIPAGKLEEGEDAASAAARELKEETGYLAEVTDLLTLYPTPGYTDEVIRVFLATSAEFVGQHTDDGEFLDVEFIPIGSVKKMIENGEICDAKTVAAIYKYLNEKGR